MATRKLIKHVIEPGWANIESHRSSLLAVKFLEFSTSYSSSRSCLIYLRNRLVWQSPRQLRHDCPEIVTSTTTAGKIQSYRYESDFQWELSSSTASQPLRQKSESLCGKLLEPFDFWHPEDRSECSAGEGTAETGARATERFQTDTKNMARTQE
jgi:hypothetical protein